MELCAAAEPARVLLERRLEIERPERHAGKPVFPQVRLEAQLQVSRDRIQALILEFIGVDLVGQADPASFLLLIDQNPEPGFGDDAHGFMQLVAAIASF